MTSQQETGSKKKKSSVRTPLPHFIAIIALTICVFLIVDLGRRAAANFRVQREAERLSQEVEAARQEQADLEAERSYISSDLYVEEVARRELKWSQPGETVVVVMPTPEALSPEASEAQAEISTLNVGPIAETPAEAWWHLFFGPGHYQIVPKSVIP